MARRDLPHWERTDVPSARKLNTLSSEIGRLTGSFTGGNDLYVDNAAGRFFLGGSATTTGRRRYLFKITETDIGTGTGTGTGTSSSIAAITKQLYPSGADAVRVQDDATTEIGDTVTIYFDFTKSVFFTDDVVWCVRINNKWQVDHEGRVQFEGTVQEDGTGTVSTCLYITNATLGDCALVTASTWRSQAITKGTRVFVEYSDDGELGERFWITDRDCADYSVPTVP